MSTCLAGAAHGLAPLLADDPAVPTRDLLLDGQAVAAWLGPALARGAAIQACACVRAKYRVGDSLRTVHRLRVDGREHWLAARTLRGERADRAVLDTLERATPVDAVRPVVHVPELGAVFWAFPNDRKIGDLRALRGGGALERTLGIRASTELVAWAPETSATARCIGADGSMVGYVKAYAGDQARATDAIHQALLRATEGLGEHAALLPRVLARSRDHRVLALEAIPGPRLLALHGDARADAIERLGAALAVLHGVPAPAAAPAFERLRPERLITAAAVIGRARPDLADDAHELSVRLVASAPVVAGEPAVCLHGDPHPANAILSGYRIALVDLDHVACGPGAADLARVLAGLAVERLTRGLEPSQERRLARRLLAGYAAVRAPAPERSLAWHTAASLLARHAVPSVGRVRPAALAALPAILAEALELIAR